MFASRNSGQVTLGSYGTFPSSGVRISCPGFDNFDGSLRRPFDFGFIAVDNIGFDQFGSVQRHLLRSERTKRFHERGRERECFEPNSFEPNSFELNPRLHPEFDFHLRRECQYRETDGGAAP